MHWSHFGDALYNLRRDPEAADAYTRAAELDPEIDLIWSYLGDAG